MMKGAYAYVCSLTLVVGFLGLLFTLGGCGHVVNAGQMVAQAAADVWTMGSEPEAHAQPGESEAEGRRRHARNVRINQQEMMADIDRVFQLNKPSKLTNRRIP
jgi:hypothetical protein